MDRTPVTSSNIASIGYDADSQTMHVEFKGGRIYEYADVEPEHHAALIDADSVGAHFARHIRPAYKGEPLE